MSADNKEQVRGLISIYRLVAHQHIVKLEDAFECRNFFYICTELLLNKSLWDYAIKEDSLSEERVKDIALKLGGAIEFLHKKGIALRNLDAKGILLKDRESYNSSKYGTLVPKITRIDGA